MFLYRSPKTALKNTQNSTLHSTLKLTFLEIFKNESFCFSQFSRNFVIFILWHKELLDMFLRRSLKTALKNTQNSPLYSILKLTFLEIFKNESFRFSQFSRNFVFQLMPRFLRSSHKNSQWKLDNCPERKLLFL